METARLARDWESQRREYDTESILRLFESHRVPGSNIVNISKKYILFEMGLHVNGKTKAFDNALHKVEREGKIKIIQYGGGVKKLPYIIEMLDTATQNPLPVMNDLYQNSISEEITTEPVKVNEQPMMPELVCQPKASSPETKLYKETKDLHIREYKKAKVRFYWVDGQYYSPLHDISDALNIDEDTLNLVIRKTMTVFGKYTIPVADSFWLNEVAVKALVPFVDSSTLKARQIKNLNEMPDWYQNTVENLPVFKEEKTVVEVVKEEQNTAVEAPSQVTMDDEFIDEDMQALQQAILKKITALTERAAQAEENAERFKRENEILRKQNEDFSKEVTFWKRRVDEITREKNNEIQRLEMETKRQATEISNKRIETQRLRDRIRDLT